MIQITEGVALGDREIEERFVRSFGSRSQNLRTEATAVELRLDIGASSLPSDVKTRLTRLAGRRVTSHGVLVLVSRANRSQAQNRDAAHARLVALLQRAATPPKTRTGTVRASTTRESRLTAKRFRGAVKRLRDPRSSPDE